MNLQFHRDWTAPKLDDAFFPVEVCKLAFKKDYQIIRQPDLFGGEVVTRQKSPRSRYCPIPGIRAIVDAEAGHVFASVSTSYKLVTNEDAYHEAAPIAEKVFNCSLSELRCANLVMPKSRATCIIDLIHRASVFEPVAKDPWHLFIRIINSYNRMRSAHYEIGLCRGTSLNALILDAAPNSAALHIEDATAKFKALHAFKLEKSWCLPLFCKVFNIHFPQEKFERYQAPRAAKQREAILNMIRAITARRDAYFTDLGANAYAVLNVLADYATFPTATLSPVNVVPGYQRKVGAWMDEFAAAKGAKNFSIASYIGNDAIETSVRLNQFAALYNT